MVRDYVKVSEQDLKLAEEFFENEKHFSEWLLNVFNYYRGKEVKIKTKIVQKYFNNYKKTMDFIINSVKTGKNGGEISAENQRVKNETLEGVVVGDVAPPVVDTVPPNIEDKTINSKEDELNKYLSEQFDEFWKRYNKGVKKLSRERFMKLKPSEVGEIQKHLPKYFAANPEKKYRKDAERYISYRLWETEIELPQATLPEGWWNMDLTPEQWKLVPPEKISEKKNQDTRRRMGI
jgi:hypothetical protein